MSFEHFDAWLVWPYGVMPTLRDTRTWSSFCWPEGQIRTRRMKREQLKRKWKGPSLQVATFFCFLILFVSWGVFGPATTFGTQAASESILCSMQVDARLIPWKNLEIPWNAWNVEMTCGCTWPHQCDLLHPSESGTIGNPIAFRGAEWLWRHGGGTAMWTKPFECEAWESLFWSHVFLLQMFLSVTSAPLLYWRPLRCSSAMGLTHSCVSQM